jgi:Restriction endonuclease
VKRHRNNVQRPDIDRFIGALSGNYPQGLFMTTASYAPSALQKATASIPHVLTLDGEQIVALMLEHRLGVMSSSGNEQKLDIDVDYFSAFEAKKSLFAGRIKESSTSYTASSDEQTIDLEPAEDMIMLNTLSYALRVDPVRVRRWVEDGTLVPDATQGSGGRTSYYFRRDRTEHIRSMLNLEQRPTSSAAWKQEFLDFAKSRRLSKSYKPVMLKAFFLLVDREGKVHIDDLVHEFRNMYVRSIERGQPLEKTGSLMVNPLEASDQAIKRLIVTYPLERFLIKNFMEYIPEEGVIKIALPLWQELMHYEVLDVLKSAEEQIRYYVSRDS